MTRTASTLQRPWPMGMRSSLVFALLAAAAWAWWRLDVSLAELAPAAAGLQVAFDLLGSFWRPATEAPVLQAAWAAGLETVVCAAAATGLALLLGLTLGFFATAAWWSGDPSGGRSVWHTVTRRAMLPAAFVAARVVIALLRSVHEVFWAILLLSAFGANRLAAVVAIAVPFAGTFAKIFSELLDEAPRESAHALRGSGAGDLQVFLFGLLPRALPDLISYAFYRFECALRAAAVLGFFGFATLGLHIRQAFLDSQYGEFWTHLWVLVLMIVACEVWSGLVRDRLLRGPRPARATSLTLPERWRHRPRSRFVAGSVLVFGGLIAASWAVCSGDLADAFSARRLDNVSRFWSEARPFPLQGVAWDWSVAFAWADELLRSKGFEAAIATLAISVLAIVLAGAGGLLASLLAARTLTVAEPFLPAGGAKAPQWVGLAVAGGTRGLLILLRAVPEYVWAFLALAMLGPSAWPAVLALALHNLGILGRLGAETVENAEPAPLAALRGLGASRVQIVAVALVPAVLPRFLLYFFYRWETCVREATVLGMLGVVSLGYWIADARTRLFHDEMLLLVMLGAAIVVVGDLASAWARRAVRRAL